MPRKEYKHVKRSSKKNEDGQVLLKCEHNGVVKELTFTEWGELLGRDRRLISRAYYAHHDPDVCLGFKAFPKRVSHKTLKAEKSITADHLKTEFFKKGGIRGMSTR